MTIFKLILPRFYTYQHLLLVVMNLIGGLQM